MGTGRKRWKGERGKKRREGKGEERSGQWRKGIGKREGRLDLDICPGAPAFLRVTPLIRVGLSDELWACLIALVS